MSFSCFVAELCRRQDFCSSRRECYVHVFRYESLWHRRHFVDDWEQRWHNDDRQQHCDVDRRGWWHRQLKHHLHVYDPVPVSDRTWWWVSYFLFLTSFSSIARLTFVYCNNSISLETKRMHRLSIFRESVGEFCTFCYTVTCCETRLYKCNYRYHLIIHCYSGYSVRRYKTAYVDFFVVLNCLLW